MMMVWHTAAMIPNGIGGDGPEPAGRAPAPPTLKLVQDFVNSVDLEAGIDRFATAEGLRSWLLQRDLISLTDDVNDEALARTLETREAIRALAGANNGVDLDPAAVQTLSRVFAAAPLQVMFGPTGRIRLQPTTPGVIGALSSILVAVYESMIEGTWDRLKACRRDVCHWVFYDYSRNRSGTWCAMAICGNRTKTKAYYRRKAKAQVKGSNDRRGNRIRIEIAGS